MHGVDSSKMNNFKVLQLLCETLYSVRMLKETTGDVASACMWGDAYL